MSDVCRRSLDSSDTLFSVVSALIEEFVFIRSA